MLLTKLKIATGVLLAVGILGTGVCTVSPWAVADQGASAENIRSQPKKLHPELRQGNRDHPKPRMSSKTSWIQLSAAALIVEITKEGVMLAEATFPDRATAKAPPPSDKPRRESRLASITRPRASRPEMVPSGQFNCWAASLPCDRPPHRASWTQCQEVKWNLPCGRRQARWPETHLRRLEHG